MKIIPKKDYVNKLNNKFERNKKIINYRRILLVVVIALIFIFSLKSIFKSKKTSKVIKPLIKSAKNFSKEILSEVNYIDGKLLWDNEKFQDKEKIRREIKGYNNIQITFDNQNKNDFVFRQNPLISVVITLYNQENKIKSIYVSILNQDLKDIEIIFVDDASTDNTSSIVNYLMRYDKRIVFLKNDINRRAFYSRYKGIKSARGEYVLVIDPDDLLLNNILIKSYTTAKKYDLDVVQFYIMIGYYNNPNLWAELKYASGILKGNSEIRKIFYYGVSRNLCDKLVRRETYLKSINFMKKQYYDVDFHINDDDTAFFGIIHVANSYGFLEQIGYFYILRSPSPENEKKFLSGLNSLFQSMCNILKYFYYESDNNTLEKYNIAYKYLEKSYKNFGSKIPYITEGFDNIIDTLNIYLNSTYFIESQKYNIKDFQNKIIERKKIVKGQG